MPGTEKYPTGVAAGPQDAPKAKGHKHRKPLRGERAVSDTADAKHRKEKRREGIEDRSLERDTIKEKWAASADKEKPRASPEQDSLPETATGEGR